jgi:hypothetical protein
MSSNRLLVVAVAALGLSFSGFAASAGSVAQSGAAAVDQATAVVKSESTFTLIKGGRGGRGGRSAGGRGTGSHSHMGSRRTGGRTVSMRGGRGFRGHGHRRSGWYDGYDCDLPVPSLFCWY